MDILLGPKLDPNPLFERAPTGGVKQFKQPAGATIPRVPPIHNQSDLMEVESHESCLDGLNVFFWERQLFLVGILFHQPFQGTKHFNGWLDLNREILRCWVKKGNKKPTPQRSLEYSPNNSELIWIADLFWRSEGWEVGGGFLSGFDEEVTCYVRWLSTLDSKHQHRTAGFSPSNLNRCR